MSSHPRCPHGFLKEAALCPECPAPPRAKAHRRGGRKRGETESHGLVGEYLCVRCGVIKPLSEFYVSRSSARGHQSRCKDCDNTTRSERFRYRNPRPRRVSA